MRPNIDISDELLREAMEISHKKTKKATIKLALQEYINMMRRKDLLTLRGRVK